MAKFGELKDLQDTDSKIDALEGKKANLPHVGEMETLREELRELELERDSIQTKLGEEEHKQKKMEGELELVSLKIEKEEKKLYSGTIASAKELSSIQEEIRSLKKQKDDQETELLEELDVIDGLRQKVAQTESVIKENSQRLARLEEEYGQLVSEIEKEVAALWKGREQILPQISEEVLALYEKLRKEKQGRAVAELKDGTCQGCGMELPAEEVDKILHSDELWQCDYCKRILIR
jgi:predicted  nucleic acid-binding Zn-ribbon protein